MGAHSYKRKEINTMALNTYYTTKEAAPIFGLAESTVSRFCRTKYLNAIKIGVAYLIHADDLRKFISEGNVRSAGQPRKVKTEVRNAS